MISRQTRGSNQGRGIGAVLVDGGLGGQSSFYSVDDYVATTNASPIDSTADSPILTRPTRPNNLSIEQLYFQLIRESTDNLISHLNKIDNINIL